MSTTTTPENHPKLNHSSADQADTTDDIKASDGVYAKVYDSDELLNYWRDQTEVFLDELIKLRCLSGLLAGHPGNSDGVNLSELAYLIDPSVDRLKEIHDELSELFYKEQVVFIMPDSEHQNKTDDA